MRHPQWFIYLNKDDQQIVLAALWASFHDNHSMLDQLAGGLHERGEALAEELNKKLTKARGPKKGAKS